MSGLKIGLFLWWMKDKNISSRMELEFDGTDISGIKERRRLVRA